MKDKDTQLLEEAYDDVEPTKADYNRLDRADARRNEHGPTKRVWLVFGGKHGEAMAVFSTEENAKKYAEIQSRKGMKITDIAEWLMDNPDWLDPDYP